MYTNNYNFVLQSGKHKFYFMSLKRPVAKTIDSVTSRGLYHVLFFKVSEFGLK